MKKRLWVLHPLLLASTLPALAAQSDEDSIIVSANRTHRTVAEMAQTTWVIEGQEIEQQVQGGKEFKDVLAQLIPGIDVSSQGRTNYGMNMRGRAIVVLIDGVRLNSSRTDSRQLDAIDPFNIEHVEVISGATSPNSRSNSAAARYSSSIIIAFIGYFYQYFLRILSSIVSVFTKITKIIHVTIK